MKFLKFLLYILLILLLGLFLVKFGELNQETVQVYLTNSHAVELDIAHLVIITLGIGLVIGIIFLILNLIFGQLRSLKKIRRDKRNRKYRHLVKNAREKFLSHNFNDAVSLNNKALKLKNEAPEALINMADIYLATGNHSKAIQIMEKVNRLKPEDKEYAFKLLEVLLEKEMYGESLQLAKDLKDRDDKDLAVLIKLREIYSALNDWDQALDYQNQVITKIKGLSRNSSGYFNLTGEQKVLARILFKLGEKNFKLGSNEEAVKNLQESIKLNPDFIPAYIAISKVYRHQGEIKEAIEVLKNALEKRIDYQCCRELEDLYILREKPNDAISFFTALQQKYPESKVLIIFFIRFYLRLEMLDKVREFIDKLTLLDKDSPAIKKFLSQLQVQESKNISSDLKESLTELILKEVYECSKCGYLSENYSYRCINCLSYDSFRLKI